MTLVDTLVSLGVLVVLAGLSAPLMSTAREEAHVIAAARYLSAQAMLARSRAVQHGSAVGLRFERDGAGGYRHALYLDGDSDGIRQADVASGVDRPLGPHQRLSDAYPLVRFELDPALPSVSGGPAGGNSDPIRFGVSDTVTFSPLGTATSGSLYLRGRSGHQCALRVLGATGRMRLLCYHAGDRVWRER